MTTKIQSSPLTRNTTYKRLIFNYFKELLTRFYRTVVDYSNLNSRELALILAIELVKKEIDNNWDFSDYGVRNIVLDTADELYKFLEYGVS